MYWPQLAWWHGQKGVGTKNEGMENVWKFTVTKESIWSERRWPGSSDRLLLEDVGTKGPRCDTTSSPDDKSMNLKQTCLDDVEIMIIMWSTGTFRNAWTEKNEYGELKVELTPVPTEMIQELTLTHRNITFFRG